MSANARLVITDGTSANTASMLVDLGGTSLDDWLPKSPQPATPIWASSPYIDGKHLVSKTYDNIIDSFTTIIESEKMDVTIHELRKFIILLERAVRYWTDEYSVDKYWLEIRGLCETNIRYAYVVDYNIPEINNPFKPPFGSTDDESTIDELQINIEHTIWTDSLVIGEDCAKISTGDNVNVGGYSYDGFFPVASDDDAFTLTPATYSDSTDLFVGKDINGETYTSGIRFKAISVPAGAIITQAYITFEVSDNNFVKYVNVQIAGQKDAHPGAFTDFADMTSRPRTTAKVYWDNVGVHNAVTWFFLNTPDLSTIIQEIVNQAGWAAGHNLVILIDDNMSDVNAWREMADTDNGAHTEATLHIEWSIYNPIEYGETIPSCARGASVVPYWNGRLLTHAYWNRAGAWSDNLVDTGMVDDTLLPPTPVVAGDSLMCCIQSGGVGSPSTPFTNLVINLHKASVGITGIDVYISTGGVGVWSLQPVNYNDICPLLPGATLGLNFITWALQAGWVEAPYHGVTGLWIKFEVTGAVGGAIPPEKENASPIYSVMWPHIQISDDEIHGDINGIIDFLTSFTKGPGFSNLLISAKKVSRTNGGNFVPYIALTSYQLAPHAAVNPLAFGWTTHIADSLAYTGWKTNLTSGATAAANLISILLEMKTYTGRFRIFLRTDVIAGAAGTVGMKLDIVNRIAGAYETQLVYNTGTGYQTYDLGLVSFPSEVMLKDNVNWMQIVISGDWTGAVNIDFYDLVFIPVDEVCLEITKDNSYLNSLDMRYPVEVITSDPKQGPYAFMLVNGTAVGHLVIDWSYPAIMQLKATILGFFNLEPDKEYWLIFFVYDTNLAAIYSQFQYLLLPVLGKSQRYLLARGDE